MVRLTHRNTVSVPPGGTSLAFLIPKKISPVLRAGAFAFLLKSTSMYQLLIAAFALLPLSAAAQQEACTQLFTWFEPGTELVYTDYNRKGKARGVSTTTVESVTAVAEGLRAQLRIAYDDDKQEAYNGSYHMTCTGDRLIIDMSQMLPQQLLESFGEFETDLEFDNITVPAELSVGQALDNGRMTMRVDMGGAMNMTVTVRTENRKVTGTETITTPAGTFETHEVSYDQHVKMMMTNSTYRVVEYWNPGVGIVKSETYGKSGKLQGYRLLTGRQ